MNRSNKKLIERNGKRFQRIYNLSEESEVEIIEIVSFSKSLFTSRSPDFFKQKTEHRMDSSPDLSLKLRRGSNDSRDSYYMDFAQGIDSDIEEVATVATAPGNLDGASDSSDSQVLVLPPAPVPADNLDSHEQDETELAIDDEALPLSPPPPPPPVFDSESIPPLATVPTIPMVHDIPTIPVGPLATSAITNLTDNSTTDEDEDLSQITPLPMPILPPLNTKTDILQMLPSKIPLVDDDEG